MPHTEPAPVRSYAGIKIKFI